MPATSQNTASESSGSTIMYLASITTLNRHSNKINKLGMRGEQGWPNGHIAHIDVGDQKPSEDFLEEKEL